MSTVPTPIRLARSTEIPVTRVSLATALAAALYEPVIIADTGQFAVLVIVDGHPASAYVAPVLPIAEAADDGKVLVVTDTAGTLDYSASTTLAVLQDPATAAAVGTVKIVGTPANALEPVVPVSESGGVAGTTASPVTVTTASLVGHTLTFVNGLLVSVTVT